MTDLPKSDYVFQSNQLSELTLYCDMYGPCHCAGKGKHWSVHQDLALMKQYLLQSGQKFWYKIKKILKNRTVDSIRNRGLLLLEYLSSEIRYNTLSQLQRVKLFIERIEQILYNHKEQCKQKIKKLQKEITQKSKIIEQLKQIRRELRNQSLQFDQTIQRLSKCYEKNIQLQPKQTKPQNIQSVTTSHPYYYENVEGEEEQVLQQQISQMNHHSIQSSQHVQENYQFEEEINNQITPKNSQCRNEYNYNQINSQMEEQRKYQQLDYSYKYDIQIQQLPFEQKLSDHGLKSKKKIVIQNPIIQQEQEQEDQHPVYSKKQKKKIKASKKQQKKNSQIKLQLEQRIKKQIYKQIIKQKIQERLDQKNQKIKQQLVNFQTQINRCNKVEDSVHENNHNQHLIRPERQKKAKQKEQQKNKVIPSQSLNVKRIFKSAPNYLQFLKKYQQLRKQGEQYQINNFSWQQIKRSVDV